MNNSMDTLNTIESISNNDTITIVNTEPNKITSDKHIMISYNQVSSGKLAKKVNAKLKLQGYKTWIDYEQMNGNINNAMAEGVDGSFVVLVFVTDSYCKSENCIKECDYASRQGKYLIPIKVNKHYNPSNITGIVGLTIGGLLYVDFSEGVFEDCFKSLLDQIRKYENPNNNINNTTTNIISITDNRSVKFVNICLMNKRMAALILAIAISLIIVLALVITFTVKFSKKSRTYEKTRNKEKAILKYCLITPDNEYIFYNGNGEWCYDKMSNHELLCYQELSRDYEGIVISLNGGIRLSSLNQTVSDPQPKWQNAKWSRVWKKLDVDQYLYPQNNDTWVELQNDKVFNYHQFLKKEDENYYFVAKNTNWYFKLNRNGFYYGNSILDTSHELCTGKWIYNDGLDF